MIEAFLNSVIDPGLKTIALHWCSARGKKLMPAWDDIQPRSIARQLSVVWCYSYSETKDEFVGRLAGAQIEGILGKSLRGERMKKLFPKKDYEWLHAACKRVVTQRSIHWGAGAIVTDDYPLGFGERIIMPYP